MAKFQSGRIARAFSGCAAAFLLAGFVPFLDTLGRSNRTTPLVVTGPSATTALPNLSHHVPAWAWSAPRNGFDIPAVHVRTEMQEPPNASYGPKTVRVETIRVDDRPAGSAAPRTASRAVPQASGRGMFVQVSAQRTEPEAQASFDALQRKYDVLRSHSPMIRRVELGGSPLYRVLVGPFGTHAQASDLCNALKDQGGQCILQRLD